MERGIEIAEELATMGLGDAPIRMALHTNELRVRNHARDFGFPSNIIVTLNGTDRFGSHWITSESLGSQKNKAISSEFEAEVPTGQLLISAKLIDHPVH